MEDTANGWLIIFGVLGIFFLGYSLGRWSARNEVEQELQLTVDEAIAILDGFAKGLVKAQHGIFSHYRDDLMDKTNKLSERLIDKKLNSAYRLYAHRDEYIEQFRTKCKG